MVTNPQPGGGTASANFTVTNGALTITGLSPSSAVANSGAFTLTINGSGFLSTSTVTFGSDTLTPTSETATSLTVSVPNSDIQTAGTVVVTVTNPGNGGSSASVNFTVNDPAPSISSLSPTSALALSGPLALTINGSGFVPATTVTFGSDNLTPTSITSSAITVTVPNSDIQTPGTVTITVTNSSPGGGSATANFTVTNPAPTITGLSPGSGAVNSGPFTLTINGSGFLSGSMVTFGGNTVPVISQSASAISVTVPNSDIQAPGTATVTVTNPAPGGGSASANFSITYATPTISSLSPIQGYVNAYSFTLTITGTGFTQASTVTFGGSVLAPTSTTAASITLIIPNADMQTAATIPVVVTNPSPGGGTATANFPVIYPPPALQSLSPSPIIANSGSFTLTLAGTGFTQASTVTYDNVSLTPTLNNPNDITVTVPNSLIQIPGSDAVAVTNPSPGGGMSVLNVAVNGPVPTITSLSPSSVAANSGSFTLTINGSGYTQGESVYFENSFLTPTSLSSTSITVTVPNSDIQAAGTYPLTVTTPAPGGGTASANLTVTAPNNPAPTISNLSPSSATANSGSFTLTINGSNFMSGSAVSFGGNSLAPTSVTSGAITVTVPNADIQTAGAVTVSVTNPAPGGGTATATFTVQTPPPPTLQSITLNPTSVTGGSSSMATVTLSGAAPSGGTVVNIASSNTSAATVPSQTITVTQGNSTATFTVSTSSVASAQNPVISASLNGTTENATLTVNPSSGGSPPGISSYYINPSYVYGGATAEGTLTLTGPVSTNTTITVTVNNPAASVPGPVVIPAGQSSVTFPVDTTPVATLTSANVTVYVGSAGKSFGLKIYPPNVIGASVSPTSVVGGSGTSVLTVLLSSAAPAGGCAVTLTSSDSTALPLSGLTVPAGATSAQLTLSPGPVAASEGITITAAAGGTSAKTTLTVTPQ